MSWPDDATFDRISDPAGTPHAPGAALDRVDKTSDLAATIAPPTAQSQLTPEDIPGFEIIGFIAKGGMGEVWEGRELTLDREVAIKVLLPGADAARFVTEAKITARLPHPSIPPVYALGKLANGSPYLAMKRIHGRNLAEELAARKHPAENLPRFVQIFEQICQAVGFAHSRGIIHRDLKPANVMVGAFGEVQVMDWGLAKDTRSGGPRALRQAHDADLADPPRDATVTRPESLTQTGAILGTPGYLAPEQASGAAVDQRADVFTLGGILTEILTAQMVYTGTDVREVLFRAAMGGTEEALNRLDCSGADGELIAIAKQCLSVDPAARPADGQAVANLVAAYRQGVEARLRQAEIAQAQAETQTREQHKRRRVIQWSAVAMASVLLAGLVASLWQMLRAMEAEGQAAAERDLKVLALRQTEAERDAKITALEAATRAKQEADQRRIESEEARKVEERERKYAQAIADFVRSDFLGLASVEGQGRFGQGADSRLGKNATLKEMLDHAAAKLKTRDDLDPRIAAELYWMIGVQYRYRAEYAKAIAFLEKCVDLRQRTFGADHGATLEAENSLALAYHLAGRLPDAIRLFERVGATRGQRMEADDPATLTTLDNLALAYLDAGRLPEAIRLFEQVRAAQEQRLGVKDPSTLNTGNNLALAYLEAGRVPEAIRLFKQVSAAKVERLGADHPDTLTTQSNLADAFHKAGRLAESIKLMEQVRAAFEAKLGHDHPETLRTQNNLAGVYLDAGRTPEAIQHYEKVRSTIEVKLGADHPHTLITLNNLGLAYQAANRLPEAMRLFERVHAAQVAKLGADHPTTLATLSNLALAYQSAGRLPEALPLFERAAQGMAKRRFQHEHAQRIVPRTIQAYEAAQNFDKSEAWRRQWLPIVKQQSGAESSTYAGELAAHGLNLLKQERWAEAEPALRECLAIRGKIEPTAWTTFNSMSMLGGALAGQAKYAEAEPLLLKGYEGLKALQPLNQNDVRHERFIQALTRLIALYTAMDRPNEVQTWQAERAKYRPFPWTMW
jgi:serine/threonine protein kinase